MKKKDDKKDDKKDQMKLNGETMVEKEEEKARIYSMEEVKIHSCEDDIWVTYEKNVLDITKFLKIHPGGSEVLLEHAGEDITDPFDDIGHSDEAMALIKKFKIGEIEHYERKVRSKRLPGGKGNSGYIMPILFIFIAVISYILFNYV